MHSYWHRGNLIYHQDSSRDRIVDAIGPDVHKYMQHFDDAGWQGTAGTAPGGWVATETEAGAGSQAYSMGTAGGGELVLTTAGNEDDGVEMQLRGEGFQMGANKLLYFGIRAKADEATELDLILGLCITDSDILGAASDDITFRSADEATDIFAVTELNSSETGAATSVGTLSTSYITYEFCCHGTTKVNFYIDGALVSTNTATLPTDEVLTPSIVAINGSAAARTLTIDWLNVISIG